MKQNLLAVFILAFFASCAANSGKDQVKTEKTEAVKKPKNVIFLIGDGMGLSQVSSAYYFNKNNKEPNFSRFPVVGLSRTSSSQQKITDSGAGATAFSTGHKSYNGSIGVDDNKKPLETLVEHFSKEGKSSGVIVTCSVTHATPAAFYAHVPSRDQEYEIARQLVTSDIDFFSGGGIKFFTKGENASLLGDLQKNGFVIDTTNLDVNKPLEADKKYGFLIAEEGLPKITEGRGDYLPKATEMGLNYLSKDTAGFFVMIEGSQIDWGGHANDAGYLIGEVLDFDKAVGKALDFAEKNGNTLVIVTADHETGGFTLSSDSGDYNKIKPTFSTSGHSATMVPVFAYGPGAEKFTGIYQNTAIYDKIRQLVDTQKSTLN